MRFVPFKQYKNYKLQKEKTKIIEKKSSTIDET